MSGVDICSILSMNIWLDQLENQMMNLKGFSQAQYFYLWLCINSKWANALEWLHVFSIWCVCES